MTASRVPSKTPGQVDTGSSIHILMSRVMKDIQAIQKDQRNPHFNYQFRGIDQVYNALWGPLTEHGVFYVPKIIEKSLEITPNGKAWHCVLTIRYRFYGPNGDYVDGEGCGEAIDTQDKASTKAQQMALKYALLSTFCIPTEEQRRDDPDSHGDVSGADVETAGTPASPPNSAGADSYAGGKHQQTESGSQQANLGGEAGAGSVAPSEEAMGLSALIIAAVNDGRVAIIDVIQKASMLLERNDQAPPKDGIDGRTLPTLGTVILKSLIRDLGLEEKANA